MGEGNKLDGGVGAWDRKTYGRNRRSRCDRFPVHQARIGEMASQNRIMAGLRPSSPFKRAARFLRSGRSWAEQQMAGIGGLLPTRFRAGLFE